MPKKIAIFVEGKTEQVFIENLLKEIAGKNRILISKKQGFGGSQCARKFLMLEKADASSGQKYFALISDCSTDSRVASDIRDQYDNLIAGGYSAIIGVRDVYPYSGKDIPQIRKGMLYGQRTKPISPTFILAIMEVEAWFLAEYSHFLRIHVNLTVENIKANFAFDPSKDDMAERPHPAEDLHNIYRLEGFSYRKSRSQIHRTVDALDYANIYLEVKNRFEDLRILTETIDKFLT